MNIFVQNATGTTRFSPPTGFGCWLEYWKSINGELSKWCPACGRAFYRSDFDGAHVVRVQANNRKMLIVPLCSGCNHRPDNFFVDSNLYITRPVQSLIKSSVELPYPEQPDRDFYMPSLQILCKKIIISIYNFLLVHLILYRWDL